MRLLRVFILSILIAGNAAAQQLPTGSWKMHFSYLRTRICEAGNEFVYATSGIGFFKVRISDYDQTRLGAMDGFHGGTISSLTFSLSLNILLIGYTDGYIDLLKNEQEIIPVNGFFNKQLQGDKSILHTCFHNELAYVSTNFGILVVDLEKYEIRDSYTSIGSGGKSLQVMSTAVLGDSLFAGLTDGVMAAKLSPGINLNDFNNWKYAARTPGACLNLTAFADSLYFYSDTVAFNYHSGVVKPFFTVGSAAIVRICKSQGNELLVFQQHGISIMNASGQRSSKHVNIIAGGTMDKQNLVWFTTGIGGGVIQLTASSGEQSIMPNGPTSNNSFAMTQDGDYLLCTAGGVSNTFGNAYNPAGFYIYHDFHWTSNPESNFNRNLYDFTFTHYNPVTKLTYVGTHTNGMLQFNGLQATNRYDDTNSPLRRDGSGLIKVSGIASDEKGNLWVTNYGTVNTLNVMSKTGAWISISLDEKSVLKVVVDQNNYKWMVVFGNGLLVYDDNGTPGNTNDDRSIRLTTNNGLLSNDVSTLEVDRNGYVWIGTVQGLNVVTSTFDVFTKPRIDQFVIEQNGTVGHLLENETINDICVDGGNRKWFATNNGVFLVAPDGQSVLEHFNTDNSPIPDNRVYCIGQMHSSGEVFFGTEAGIISYRSDASGASNSFGNIKIYPNPVKPGYEGSVTIEGLAQDAEIRITDAAGVLIYQTKANGGTATWPCTRLDGSKPNSGVLYVFGINSDGTETAMGKFIYVR